jgi:hypothetical protein
MALRTLKLARNKVTYMLLMVVAIIVACIVTIEILQRRGSDVLGVVKNVTVLRQSGDIFYKQSDADSFIPLSESQKTISADSIVKTEDAVGYILLNNQSMHTLNPFSELYVQEIAQNVTIFQTLGRVFHSFNPSNELNSQYTIETPDVSATVRGTSFEVEVILLPDGSYNTTIHVIEGEVVATVLLTGEEVVLTSGEGISNDADGLEVRRGIENTNQQIPELISILQESEYVFDEDIIRYLLTFVWNAVEPIIPALDTQNNDDQDSPTESEPAVITRTVLTSSPDIQVPQTNPDPPTIPDIPAPLGVIESSTLESDIEEYMPYTTEIPFVEDCVNDEEFGYEDEACYFDECEYFDCEFYNEITNELED